MADLLVSKTDGTAVYTPGLPITYQIVVLNDGPSHAVGFAIDDVVPAAITGVGASCVVTSGDGTCGTNDTAGNTVAFSGAALTAGSTLDGHRDRHDRPRCDRRPHQHRDGDRPRRGRLHRSRPDQQCRDGHRHAWQSAGRSGDHEGRRPDELCGGDADQLHGDSDQRRTVHGNRRLPERRSAGRDHQPDGDLRRDGRAPTAAAEAPCAARLEAWAPACRRAAC